MASWVVFAAAILLASLSIWYYDQTKKVMERMDELLDKAINGEVFYEEYLDTYEDKIIEKMKDFIRSSDFQLKKMNNENENVQALISNIAHQTKTPITNISIFSELLQETTHPAEISEYVTHINHQAVKLNYLIEELMKTSYLENRLIQTKKEKNDYHQLFAAVLPSFRQLAEKKGICFFMESFPETEGFFDEKWSKEALANLLDNAIKYGKVNSVIKLTFRRLESFDCLSVTNTGAVITEEEQGKIFQRFYRGSRTDSVEGLGIGLYLVRNIMQLQEGFVKLSAQENRNTFSLFFKR